VDEGLLGGLTVRIGSRVLDGSVRGELESLRRRLVAQA
jgi:F0F1-type ATP synthase delta subunit